MSIVPFAGQTVGPEYHRSAHLISFAVLGLSWTWAVVRAPVSVIALSVIGFGALQEGIEIYGHAHPFEMGDVIIDALGAVIGVVLGYAAKKLPVMR